jgi:hypothetical protein
MSRFVQCFERAWCGGEGRFRGEFQFQFCAVRHVYGCCFLRRVSRFFPRRFSSLLGFLSSRFWAGSAVDRAWPAAGFMRFGRLDPWLLCHLVLYTYRRSEMERVSFRREGGRAVGGTYTQLVPTRSHCPSLPGLRVPLLPLDLDPRCSSAYSLTLPQVC